LGGFIDVGYTIGCHIDVKRDNTLLTIARVSKAAQERDTRDNNRERLGPSKPSLMNLYPQATASSEQAQIIT
jgi:hypothetical protein